MPNKFISDTINPTEIKKWNLGDRILIHSQTGSGKSFFIKDVLYEYCEKNNKKILLLSNRNLLKNQNQEELSEAQSKIIVLKNYQTLESSVLSGNSLSKLFSDFDYICFDEVHYLLSDSAFNGNTDILLANVKFPIHDKISIFLSATPQAILKYNKNFEHTYTIEQDYSFIENLYFYNNNEMVENIISNIPQNEKILYFGNALNGFEFSMNKMDSEFICSDNNKEFKRKSSKSTMKEIVTKNEFSCRILFATKVLDNGVNIISPQLKHIIIDMVDPIDVIQCLGRKRISENEKITLYVKNQNGRNIYPQLKMARERLKILEEIQTSGKEEFQKKYARKQIDNIIMNDGEINWAKVYQTKYIEDVLSKMMRDKDGYKKYIIKIMGVEKVLQAEDVFEKKNLSEILETYLEKPLYKEDQEEFKNIFFANIFNLNRNINVRHRGIVCVNSILEEDELPFRLTSMRNMKRGEDRGKTYWLLIKL